MRKRRQAVRIKSEGPGVGARILGLLSAARRPCLFWVFPSAALVGLCIGGLHLCRSYVSASDRYAVLAPKVNLFNRSKPPPQWWEKAFEDEINKSCAFANGASMLEPGLLEKIADGYRACPWVKDVRWVRKRFPSRVEASIIIRWPKAAVAVRTRRGLNFYLVGKDAVRLPKVYHKWPQPGLNVPAIVGTRMAPPAPGERWPEKSVTDAIAILKLLENSKIVRSAVSVTGIDVSNYHGRVNRRRSEFLILAEGNCVIEWGRAPDTGRLGELPVKEKIAKLERFLKKRDPTSNRRLGLRFAGPVVVRRFVTDGDSS